ncbi:MAG: hypothetical protein ABIR62_11520, partial [Dokdonella sp.]|uniref:hypothetical protein n=1 Tax=Dokdonella sp. TaxID=2291710 RepID=UPI0032654430
MNQSRFVLQCIGALAATGSVMPVMGAVTVTTPSTSIAVEPGSVADIPFLFSNDGNEASNEFNYVLDYQVPGYSFEQRSPPECGPLIVIQPTLGRATFSVAPIAAHSQRTCVVRVTRDVATVDNGFADWLVAGDFDSRLSLAIGTFVDLSITATPVSSSVANGIQQEVFRVDARNLSVIDVGNVVLALGSVCVPSAVTVDTDFAGGCERADLSCGFGGGASAPAVKLSSITAGQTQSCLVRISAPVDAHASVQSSLAPELLTNAATGGRIGDRDDSNNSPLLQLVAQPTASAAVSAPDIGLVAKLLA